MMATALVIDIMLHYATRGGDYRTGSPDTWPPAVKAALVMLCCDARLLDAAPAGVTPHYRVTQAGQLYVERLRAVPLDFRPTAEKCRWCGRAHEGVCLRVRRIEFEPTYEDVPPPIRAVEFFPPQPPEPIISDEEVLRLAGRAGGPGAKS